MSAWEDRGGTQEQEQEQAIRAQKEETIGFFPTLVDSFPCALANGKTSFPHEETVSLFFLLSLQ